MAKSQAYMRGVSKPSNMGKTLLVDNVNEERILSKKVVQLEVSKKKIASSVIQQKYQFLNNMEIKQEKWLKDHTAQAFQINQTKKRDNVAKKKNRKKIRKNKKNNKLLEVNNGQTKQPKPKNSRNKQGKGEGKYNAYGSEYIDDNLDCVDHSFKRSNKGKLSLPVVSDANKYNKFTTLPPIDKRKVTIPETKMSESFPQIDFKRVAILDQYSKKINNRKPRKLSPVGLTVNPLNDERYKSLKKTLQPLKPVAVEDFGSLMTAMNMARKHLLKFRARKRKAKQFKTEVYDFVTVMEKEEAVFNQETELTDDYSSAESDLEIES